MKINNGDEHFLTQGPGKPAEKRKRLSEEEKDEILDRLIGEEDVSFREVDSPFDESDDSEEDELEDLLKLK